MPEMEPHAMVPGRASMLGAGFRWEEKTISWCKKELNSIRLSLRVNWNGVQPQSLKTVWIALTWGFRG